MSYVADTIIWTALEEETAIAGIQAWLAEHDYGQLVEISNYAGGKKAVQASWWAGAFNYLKIQSFLQVVFSQSWEYPNDVRVIIKDEHDDVPTMYAEANAISRHREYSPVVSIK